MHKSRLNFIIDSIALLLLLTLVSTGSLIYLRLPPRTARSLSVWGMNRHEWGEIHFVLALVFVAILILHIILHWHWIKTLCTELTRRASTFQKILSLIVIAVIAALVFSPLLSPITQLDSHSERGRHG